MEVSEKDLQQFLDSAGLGGYLGAFNKELMVHTLQQLHGVTESEMKDIRMPKPDVAKLKKALKKDPAKSGKNKKLTRSSSDVSKNSGSTGSLTGGNSGSRITISHPKPSGKSIPSEDLLVGEERLAEGGFCDVYKGTWLNNGHKYGVLVKRVHRVVNLPADFEKTCTSIQALSHEGVCAFYGVSYAQDSSVSLISEWAPLGSLQTCLRNPALRSSFSLPALCEVAQQTASAMAYLESAKFVHRDLAARNVLVFTPAKVKVGDCAFSKAMGASPDFYLQDLSLRAAWMAPETMRNQTWSSASDIWSYGVTLWEIFSYGQLPWESSSPDEVIQAVTDDQRLSRPEFSPSSHYMLMERCWHASPEKRPTFASIVRELTAKPLTRMKAVKNSPSDPTTVSNTDMLRFREGEEIFVIDMKPLHAPAWHYWKGVASSGVVGYFNPADCTDQTRIDPPAAASPPEVNLRSKKSLKSQSRKSRMSKPKLSASMIGWPKDDFRHTGHIGMDGATFGNIDHIAAELETLPKSRTSLQGSSTADIPEAVEGLGRAVSAALPQDRAVSAALPPDRAIPAALPQDRGEDSRPPPDDDELGDFSIPDLSFSVSDLGLSTSFIDEMMKGLHTDKHSKKRRSSGSSNASSHNSDDHGPINNNGMPIISTSLHSGTNGTRKTNGLLPGRERKDSASSNGGGGGVKGLKQMSAAEEKMLDDAIELANQFSAKSDLSPSDSAEPDTPSGKSKSRFFKFPSSKKSSPKAVKKTSFTDDLNSKSAQLAGSSPEEAEDVYNQLIARPSGSSQEDLPGSHELDRNGMRRMKKDGGSHPVRSQQHHQELVRQHSKEHNPPLPPRQSRLGSGASSSPPLRSRPKETPPLPPPTGSRPTVGSSHRSGSSASLSSGRPHHDDLSDMPSTPPPPVPLRRSAQVDEDGLEEMGLYNSMDPFWREDMRLSGEEDDENTEPVPMQGKYKSRSDNVSYEDLSDFSSQNNLGNDPGKTHRVMQKVLSDVTTLERENALLATNGNIHKAVKYVRLRQLLRLRLGDVERCKEALMQSNWIVQSAADYLLDHPPPSPDTVDV